MTKHVKVDNIRLMIKEHRDEIRQLFKAEIVGIFGSYARVRKVIAAMLMCL
jgi:hypothetical protein